MVHLYLLHTLYTCVRILEILHKGDLTIIIVMMYMLIQIKCFLKYCRKMYQEHRHWVPRAPDTYFLYWAALMKKRISTCTSTWTTYIVDTDWVCDFWRIFLLTLIRNVHFFLNVTHSYWETYGHNYMSAEDLIGNTCEVLVMH